MYPENNKILLREKEKDLNKWRDIPCSWLKDSIVLRFASPPN
jgi:hypothetical protein